MMKRFLSAGLVVLACVACRDPLSIGNDNSPDRERVFNTPADLQVFISGLFAVMLQSTTGSNSNDNLQNQMAVMALENTSALANFAMGPRGSIPRNPITNQRGSQGNQGNYHDWFRGHRAARMAVLGYAALDNLSLGSPAADARARAFARLVQGIALGNLSLAYDSASILTEFDNPEADAGVVVALSGYQAVNAAALRYLDSAIAIARVANVGQDPAAAFLPSTANFWINGMTVDTALFIRIARSYKARFRAHVARTPAERAAVDWAVVIADANAGITADFTPRMDAVNGWDVSWMVQHFASAAWHQMPQFFIGMADTSGAYNTYLATPNPLRASFTIVTPDRRFPQGTTRALQSDTIVQTYARNAGQVYTATPYFKNRLSGDLTGEPLSVSQYDFWRSRDLQQKVRVGNWPVLTVTEIRLLAAEGYIRLNQFGLAIPLINVSRQAQGQLPAISTAIADTLTPVSVGASCVPKVPDATAGYATSKCGNVWDALKYEYRLETAFMGYGNWFFPGRGWGDLPHGTALQWPVPYDEMDARRQAFYGFGGVGGMSSSAPGNYGLFTGGVY